MPQQSRVFESICGQVCWAAWKGFGSVFFLDFGAPAVEVTDHASGRRHASVRGEWFVCVEYATWRVKAGPDLLAHSESSDAKIAAALKSLRGQILIGHSIARGSHVLEFDLGGTIEVRRYRDTRSWPLETSRLWYATGHGLCDSWFADGSLRAGE